MSKTSQLPQDVYLTPKMELPKALSGRRTFLSAIVHLLSRLPAAPLLRQLGLVGAPQVPQPLCGEDVAARVHGLQMPLDGRRFGTSSQTLVQRREAGDAQLAQHAHRNFLWLSSEEILEEPGQRYRHSNELTPPTKRDILCVSLGAIGLEFISFLILLMDIQLTGRPGCGLQLSTLVTVSSTQSEKTWHQALLLVQIGRQHGAGTPTHKTSALAAFTPRVVPALAAFRPSAKIKCQLRERFREAPGCPPHQQLCVLSAPARVADTGPTVSRCGHRS
ncbi:germ cell-specific gene 1 protein [Sorex araneus]|uniref:germ cell-specific gene 1 protein n=1 Tax=Sorex araneus TaxID=42254 RepID=UPI002433C4B9|nr:germ cell-specific gene 1 protein [Sorex araneus]